MLKINNLKVSYHCQILIKIILKFNKNKNNYLMTMKNSLTIVEKERKKIQLLVFIVTLF